MTNSNRIAVTVSMCAFLIALLVSLQIRPSLGQGNSDDWLNVELGTSEGQANPGDGLAAIVLVSVTSSQGLVSGLTADNFTLTTPAFVDGGCEVVKQGFADGSTLPERLEGFYLLTVVPDSENSPNCFWQKGAYLLGISVRNGSASGAGVAELKIDVY